MTCCVPLCDSIKRKRETTFHEFPANLERRIKWIRAIARKDPETNGYWCPLENELVCGLHFTPDEFKKHERNKRNTVLIPGSVPSIFPGYPDYLLCNTPDCKRFRSVKDALNFREKGNNSKVNSHKEYKIIKQCFNDKSIDMHSSLVSPTQNSDISNDAVLTSGDDIEQVQTSCNKSTDIHQSLLKNSSNDNGDAGRSQNAVNPSNESSQSSETLSKIVVNIDSSIQKFPITYQKNIIEGLMLTATNSEPFHILNSNTLKQDRPSLLMKENHTLPSESERKVTNVGRSKKFRLDEETYKLHKRKIWAVERQNRRYRSEILKLRERNKEITEKLKKYNIEELEKSVENREAKGLFFIDQLRAFTNKDILWSTSTMDFAQCLEEKFPALYDFLRQTDIISLPSPKILRFNDMEIGDIHYDNLRT